MQKKIYSRKDRTENICRGEKLIFGHTQKLKFSEENCV